MSVSIAALGCQRKTFVMMGSGVFVPAGLDALLVKRPMDGAASWTGVRVTPLDGGTTAVSQHSLTSCSANTLASISGYFQSL